MHDFKLMFLDAVVSWERNMDMIYNVYYTIEVIVIKYHLHVNITQDVNA